MNWLIFFISLVIIYFLSVSWTYENPDIKMISIVEENHQDEKIQATINFSYCFP